MTAELALLLIVLIMYSWVGQALIEAEDSVTIRPWQYCEGCKHAVYLYSTVSAAELQRMYKAKVPNRSQMEAGDLAEGLCDNVYYSDFQPFLRWSCIKIMHENRVKFLEEFAGEATLANRLSNAENFRRKRHICGKHLKACEHTEFQKGNITLSNRTKCTGCRLLAKDIDITARVLAKNATLKSYLENRYCTTIGHNFYPFSWLEEQCEEMVEEHADAIVSIINLQGGIMSTGLSPSKSTDDMMCEEFYKCPPAAPAVAREL